MRAWHGIGRRLALGLLLAPSGAAWAQPSWQNDLGFELDFLHQCRIAYLSHVVERWIDGRHVVMAKAHCDDARVYDAMRPGDFEPFQLSECRTEDTQGC